MDVKALLLRRSVGGFSGRIARGRGVRCGSAIRVLRGGHDFLVEFGGGIRKSFPPPSDGGYEGMGAEDVLNWSLA